MTVLDTPENLTASMETTTSTAGDGVSDSSSDTDLSLRRRRSSTNSAGPVAELSSKIDKLESDVDGKMTMDPGPVAESGTLKSNGKDSGQDKDKVEKRGASDVKFTYRPSVPAHRVLRESPLSSDNIFKQSHAGLFNLCVVVLVAVNSRLIIENLMKYGWLIKTGFWFSSRSLRDWPLLMSCLTLPVFSLAAYLVEKLAYRKYISESIVVFFHVLITSAAVICPVSVILSCESAVLSGVTLMLFACIEWLKLVSYAHTNHDMRAVANSIDKGDALSSTLSADYCRDVSFKSLVYFMVAPTLCYQPIYPRTACVRKGCVVRQFVKLIIFTGFMGFIIEQYINPIVQNSQHPLKGDLLNAIERVLKLSVPNLYVWLCMFYCFFHLWLNILAELLCFGDREFYKDWWNARTVDEYWRMWNMPVHKWMVRHVYFPCLRHNVPKGIALIIAFFVSAVFHEIPLVVITSYLQDKLRSPMVGNMIFWIMFCILGQPMCVLLYYHDLMNRKGSTESI
ncbi:hypothetical protein MANES_03G036000v8 [Manihot esculenta]|uniref:Uncharacterized protein n=1 Tax=Manihot esculenta TaxID=3983 RepID=A0ACB7I1W4_MANES|nr:hypothetical protein MANES_03G036000v8 [Manihot esculenta]